MTRQTKEALEWLLTQPEFSLHRDNNGYCVAIGTDTVHAPNAHDCIVGAYEKLYLERARETLPDYRD